MTQQAERRRDRSSFQELAKMAQTPPPPSVTSDSLGPQSGRGPLSAGPSAGPQSGIGPASAPAASNPLVWPSTPSVTSGPWSGADSDSGMVDLKSMSQSDPAAADRAKGTALASEGLFEDEPAAAPPAAHSSGPIVAPLSAAPAIPATSAAPAVSAVSSIGTPSGRGEKKKGAGALIGIVAVLGAMAAGGFLFVKTQGAKKEAAVAAAPAQVAPAAAPKPVEVAPPPAAAVVEEQPATPAEPEAVAAAPTKGGKKAKPGFKVHGGAAAPEAAKEEVAAKGKDGNITGFTSTLQQEMEKRSGGEKKGEEKVEVATDTRGLQPKPSQGQVQGAIGTVLMKARECLGPDDPVSKANVVFGSSGAVQSVSVSGGASGKPAEACIKGALGKAKVPAFADPTYSFPVTVRPL